jgi:hypothetical protein
MLISPFIISCDDDDNNNNNNNNNNLNVQTCQMESEIATYIR